MKKLFLSFIAISMASLYSLTARADRVAPIEPTVTLTDGGEYYLYNVGHGNAVHYNSAASSTTIYPRAFNTHATKVTFNTTDDGYYTIKLTAANKYFYRNSSTTIQANSSSKSSFAITEVEGGYTFQTPKSSYYNENQYMGFVSSYDYLRADVTSNIVWKILPAEDESFRYIAKLRLYNCLCKADDYSFYIDNYEAIYENEASTNEELNAAADALSKSIRMSTGYQAPWWNERPILFYTADGNFGQSESYTWALPNGTYFYTHFGGSTGSRTLSATLIIDEPSTFVYSTSGGGGNDDFDSKIQVYVDDKLVRTLIGPQISTYPGTQTYARFFEKLQPGRHTIKWVASRTGSDSKYFYIRNAGVVKNPLITVSLLEPGSLGTEVLYNTDHVKNVRRLKVKGAMNADDWAKIKMMSTLLELDLSEAEFTEVPEGQFRVTSSDTLMQFLHHLILPEGVTKINKEAFRYSFIDTLALPSTLRNIRENAFDFSHIQEINMPDDCTEIYGSETNNSYNVFGAMKWLRKLKCAKNWTIIPSQTFYNCTFLEDVTLPDKLEAIGDHAFAMDRYLKVNFPEGLKRINEYAFQWCYWAEFGAFPESLQTINRDAFCGCGKIVNLVIPQNVSSIANYAFENCTNLTTVELGVYQYSLANGVFQECNKLKTVKLKSPTVTTISETYPISDITAVTIQVPHYLVNSYKLHKYWYNAKAIEPFDYSDIEYIPLRGNLTLNHERFGGQPSIEISSGYYLKINGENEQRFNNIKVNVSGYNSNKGQLLNNCENITATGDNYVSYGVEPKKWYFISLPFDLDVSRINPGNGVQYAIRYYDGAGRAANGKSGNWKNVDRTSIIPAGTGFIFQTNNSSWTWFYAADTENKYGTLRTTEFNKTLDVNASETTSNKGWNLVGNPYQCFYNNHCLNFTAPITVWNGSTYVAYSLTDDDYAIRPNEAFFVQCPNEEYNTIGFPLQGRQLTSVIESQNAVKELAPQAKSRQVVNLTVSNGEMEDMTRVVLNEEASMAYETSCDASKFMSMDGSVPQIYTLDGEGTWYAINERPVDDGNVALGFYAGQEGSYTISVTRCDAEKVFLTDNLTGETVDITGSAYTFSAKAGTDNTRFTLSFVANDPTAINEIDNGQQTTDNIQTIYDLNGRQIVNGKLSNGKLSQGIYIIRQGKKASKVIVR